MKGIKHVFAALVFLCAASTLTAQSESQVTNELSIEVFDIITGEPLRDYGFLFINEQDTLKMQIDSIGTMKIDLDEPNHYTVTVFKDGYGQVSADFDNPSESAEIFLEFFVPKNNMSKKEKRAAYKNHKQLPPSVFDEIPGFAELKLDRKEMLVMRFFAKGSTTATTMTSARKIHQY